jgi:hypothetical protein
MLGPSHAAGGVEHFDHTLAQVDDPELGHAAGCVRALPRSKKAPTAASERMSTMRRSRKAGREQHLLHSLRARHLSTFVLFSFFLAMTGWLSAQQAR